MCGIGAVINYSFSADVVRRLVISLINNLSIRGSDAAGIAAFKDGRVFVAKASSPWALIEKLRYIEGWEEADVILVHTRAATTCFDSYWCHHPIIDVIGDDIVALVHNGVVYKTPEPVPSRYDVDTDLLMGIYRRYGFTRRALDMMLKVDGWLAVIATNGREVHVVKRGAPLFYADVGKWRKKARVYASTKEILTKALRDAMVKNGRKMIKPAPHKDAFSLPHS